MEYTANKQIFTTSRQPSIGLSLLDDYPNASHISNVEHLKSEKIQAKTKALQLALNQAGLKKTTEAIKFHSGKAPTICTDWLLSLSHSGTWLYAGAVSTKSGERAVHFGIDIEQMKQRNFLRLNSFLGWQQPAVNATHFYRRWTLTESLYKALSSQPNNIDFSAWFKMLDEKLLENITTSEVLSINFQGWYWQVEWPHFCDNVIACVTYGLAPR